MDITLHNMRPESPVYMARPASASSSVYSDGSLIFGLEEDKGQAQRDLQSQQQLELTRRKSGQAFNWPPETPLSASLEYACPAGEGKFSVRLSTLENSTSPFPGFDSGGKTEELRHQKSAEPGLGTAVSSCNMAIELRGIAEPRTGTSEPKEFEAQASMSLLGPTALLSHDDHSSPLRKVTQRHATFGILPDRVMKLSTLTNVLRKSSNTMYQEGKTSWSGKVPVEQAQWPSMPSSNEPALREGNRTRGYLSGEYVTAFDDLEQPEEKSRKRKLLGCLFGKLRWT
ncbi:hypothetical protein J1614_000415 [Plenodomus biglobosus]|nr:hypothetical protein J1614_000415 [Plenodomus biglobosus]